MTEPTVAAIDCGTNSTRLLVRSPDGETLERLMRITRLGEGVDATGRLDPAAIERTIDVLREYREVMDRLGVTRSRMSATSAARDASNRDEFFDAAEAVDRRRPRAAVGRGGRSSLVPRRDRRISIRRAGRSSSSTSAAARPSSPTAPTTCEATLSLDIGCVRADREVPRARPAAARGAVALRSRSSRCTSTT